MRKITMCYWSARSDLVSLGLSGGGSTECKVHERPWLIKVSHFTRLSCSLLTRSVSCSCVVSLGLRRWHMLKTTISIEHSRRRCC